MTQPLQLSAQQIQDGIPLFNQWDVIPAVGTMIGQARIIYGIFMLFVGAVAQCFDPANELFQTALYHISRGFESLFSFIPSISETMIEKDIAAVKAEALKALGQPPLGGREYFLPEEPLDGAGRKGTAFDTATGGTGNDFTVPVAQAPDY